MMRLSALILHALLLAALSPAYASAGGAGDVTVFVPESLTSVSSENVPLAGEKRVGNITVLSTTGKKVALVGKIEGGMSEMDIINNGRSHIHPVFHDSYFHAQVTLSLGVNLLEVRWRKKDGPWNSKTVSIFRSSKVEGGVTGNYPPYVFHKGDNEEHCQECHQMKLTQSEKETGMEKSCLRCHKGLTDNLYVHGPVGVGICTVCHDPESTPNKFKIQESDNFLCYHCHEDRKAVDDSRKLLHGPVGAGMCTVCHDPHGSPYEFQLIKAKAEICIMCHQEDADRWMGQASLHPPFKSGNCADCHDPHSADYNYNLKADRKEICGLCHELPVPGHLHLVGRVPQFRLPEDYPVDEEGRTMCLTCHDPHGAPGAHLTRGDGCDGCHPK